MAKLAGQFFKRVQGILEAEEITFDKTAVAEVIQKHFPDWRRVLNELQRYAAIGSIDAGILTNMTEVSINVLMGLLKEKNFTEIRKWVGENSDNDQNVIMRSIYDNASKYFDTPAIAELILILSKYQYQAAFAADSEINVTACLIEIMMGVSFK